MSSPQQAISDQRVLVEGSSDTKGALPSHDDIAGLAHQLWEYRMRNHTSGSAEQDWFEAERQVRDAGKSLEVEKNLTDDQQSHEAALHGFRALLIAADP